MQIENARRMLLGIISESDLAAPLYNELSSATGLSYNNIKRQLRKNLYDYLQKYYDLKKRYTHKNNSFDSFLKEDETAVEALSYILKLYGTNEKIINTIREI